MHVEVTDDPRALLFVLCVVVDWCGAPTCTVCIQGPRLWASLGAQSETECPGVHQRVQLLPRGDTPPWLTSHRPQQALHGFSGMWTRSPSTGPGREQH